MEVAITAVRMTGCAGDLWGLGVAIYLLLSGGRTPFTALELMHLGRGTSLDEQQRWLQARLDSWLLHGSQANLRVLSSAAQVHSHA